MAVNLSPADRARIVEAVTRAERGHRGEIVVHIEARCLRHPLERAARLFRKRGVDRTREQTGVLLYVAPSSRRAAVWAGDGVEGGAEVATWQPVFDALAAGHRDGDPVAGIVRAIAAIGEVLTTRAAGEDRHGNELDDGVSS